MSVASDVLKNYNVFVDGRGYAGRADIQLPNLEIQTEDHRAGGMDMPIDIDMGMNKLEATITSMSFDKYLLSLFGIAEGNSVPLTARGALESLDGTVTPIVVNMRGLVRKLEFGAWEAGQKTTVEFGLSLRYYKYTQGGEVLHEIDPINMMRIIGGVDQRATIRNAIGLD